MLTKTLGFSQEKENKMEIKVGDTLGYISRCLNSSNKDGYEYKFTISKVNGIRFGKKKTSVYAKDFFALDYEDIEYATDMMSSGKLVLVDEVFVCNDKDRLNHYKKLVEYWNEHGAESIFDSLSKQYEGE